MLERIEDESLWLGSPDLADVFVGGEALQGLEPAGEVVGSDEVAEMVTELLMAAVVEAMDGGFLDGPTHALDLAVGPRMLGLGQTVIDVVLGAGILEGVSPEALAIGHCLLDLRDGVAASARRREVDAIVGENGMDLVRHRLNEMQKEVGRGSGCRLLMRLDEGELRRSIDGDEEMQLALFGAHFGNVDVEVADRVGLELAFGALAILDVRQPCNAMPLQAAMQGRAGQMRDCRLKGIQAIVEWQQRMLAERDDDRLVLKRQTR